jgi:hypothetical protein
MNRAVLSLAWGAPVLFACSTWGCNLLLDTSAYHVAADTDSNAPGQDAAVDATSADACPSPTNRVSLENACTNAACEPFMGDVPMCDGSLCPLPVTGTSATGDAGATGEAGATSEAGTTDEAGAADPTGEGGATSDSGATGDAGAVDAATLDSTDAAADSAAAEAGDDATAPDSGALPSCASVRSDPNSIIFVTGSTALASFIGEVSKVLATQPTNPVTVVYQQSGSCVGVRAAIDPVNNPLLQSLGASTYYDASGTIHSCALNASDGLVADIGASDVFFSTCYFGLPVTPALPQSVSENLGPVQVMNFAVPQGSTERSISLAAAYYVFGFGGAPYSVAPWVDPTQLQIRSAASGTQAMIAAAIGVPPGQWKGVGNSTSSGVGTALVMAGQNSDSTVVNSALGILASDYLLQNAQTLRGLAVQDENTGCGYFPSTTSTAHDDANVRNGHYPLWGPSHFYARVDPQRQIPLKAGVSQFIDGLSGVTQLPGLDLVGEYAAKGLVPSCAMSIARSDDGGDYTPYKPAVTCNCYFDLIATGATACSECNTNADCPSRAPNCNKFGASPQQGYCDL